MKINYQIEGPENAPVIVLSNSLGTTLSMWQPQISALTSHFRVLRYDTHGHGKTEKNETVTLAQLGEDVVALLDHLAIEKAHFCGISMGGLTGLWLARYKPQRFHSVTVLNSAAKIGEATGWLSRAQAVREKGMQAIAATAPERWFSESYRLTAATHVAFLCQQLAESSPEGYASCCEALANADLRAELSAIDLPVLLIAGELDPVTTVADAQFMQQKIDGSRLEIVTASHLSSIEAPEVLNALLIEFCGGNNAR